ncbi:MAG: hypothetical protein CSB24_04690 [Deltaproteobacteria bacterium]|nr:MAG: hypothetical protein CSB24_04690 [Deltaproteobacteria bacterium]
MHINFAEKKYQHLVNLNDFAKIIQLCQTCSPKTTWLDANMGTTHISLKNIIIFPINRERKF